MKKAGYDVHFTATLQKAYSFWESNAIFSRKWCNKHRNM